MSEQLTDALMRLAAVWCLVGLWLLTIVYVFWDANRRNLGDQQVLQWVMKAAIPFVGFALYLHSRQAQARPASYAAQDRMTRVRPHERTRREGNLSTIPADAWRSQSTPSGNAALTLVGLEGPYAGAHFEVHTFPVRIGRTNTCQIFLTEDVAVSREHAEIYRTGGEVRLRNLESTHGTYLNGNLIADEPLYDGDTMQVGNSSFILIGRR